MNLSFYTAAVGAKAQQDALDVTSNNIANLQSDGYLSQRPGFVDLLYENYYRGAEDDPETGAGARLEKTDLSFEKGGFSQTLNPYDFAIDGEGFFATFNPETEEVRYTRNGAFHLSNFGENLFYLAASDGSLVLDKNLGLIPLYEGINSETPPEPGVFDFQHKEGFLSAGGNFYMPVDKNGAPIRREDAKVLQGYLESSNVDMAYEMTRIIETQRAFQMSLRMVQTSDEIEQTINSLRR